MRRALLLVGIAVLPAMLGLVVALVWWAAGERGSAYAIWSLAWTPFLVGAAVTLWALPAMAAIALMRRREDRVRRQAHHDQAASRGRLLARLDHEIKNPIQGIRAALADEPSPRQRESIDAQARRLTGLLGDLRKIADVEHTELELTAVDPTALVEEVVAAIADVPGAAERRISVSLPRAPRPLPSLVGDEDLLFLCLLNVLSNAVKYSRDGDAIEVRGRALDHAVSLEIADTGRGIAPDELETVWEELGRSREVRGVEGTGLGLPMVRAIIARHRGAATLESWHGEGSTVTLTLPVDGPAGRRGPAFGPRTRQGLAARDR